MRALVLRKYIRTQKAIWAGRQYPVQVALKIQQAERELKELEA